MGQTPLPDAFYVGEVLFTAKRVYAALALMVALGFAVPAAAEPAAEFYKDKVVKLVVGYGAGGGYDTYARMLAPHLEERLGATVVVENRPGGGGNVALNQIAGAKPDGLTIMLIASGSAAFSQVMEAEGVRFDVGQLGLLGRVAGQSRVLLWSGRSPYRSLEDALTTPRTILFGGISRTDTISASVAFLAEALDLNAKIVTGYKGTKEVALAAIRGEVDGFSVSASSGNRYVRDGDLIASFIVARERSPLLPDVPTIFELLEVTPGQAWWLDYTAALLSLGRALVTTPDVPSDRLAYLQKAVAAVVTDPDVVAEAESVKRPLSYMAPAEFRRLLDAVVGRLSAEELAKVRHVAQAKFY